MTYDEAIASQCTHAARQLAEAGLVGTFFLKGASEELAAHPDEWHQRVAAGHELASHTMHHPCDRKFDWVPRGYASQDYDLARMKAELAESRQGLVKLGAATFHGVGGDYLSVELNAHRALLVELKARENELWIAPFGEVAARIKSQRE